jgi:sterol desaturase/sphingolipid hydroxylase (fatty acid hydroxylase superfamily)
MFVLGLGGAAALGVVSWTFLEYLIHRFFGHHRRFRRTPFGVEHTRHHIEGDYFAPTWKKLVSACVVTLLVGGLAIQLVGLANGLGYVLGLMSCYATYEWAHRFEHTHAAMGPYGRWARRHHFRHHLVDARSNFGVTTPLWDLVFRTYEAPPAVIKVPPRLAMRWLLDPATGQVAAPHAATFELARRKGDELVAPDGSTAR